MFEAVTAAGALFLSGTISGVSMLAIPVALDTAKTQTALLEQWRTIYLNGHIKGPAIAVTVGTAMAVIAGLKYQDGADARTSVVAAIATAGIVPYTWIVMNKVNRTLHSLAAGAGSEATDAGKLVVTWSRMNAVRGALPLVGGLVSLWGIISS
ncbi:hypothetical protein EKO04_010541 [Ascochyta lentis]|uniref:DUF1772-domain-containing protein n=1 Tax=Ascochyta lentis TaxID=205686 RepID=A0A8H7MBR0_9PLEO|nr:hypothetical protein EKO04_010541 [Ascochyta lentis]